MTYNSIYFAVFFAVFLVLYLIMPNVKMRRMLILLGNLVFYFYAGGLSCLAVVTGTSLIVYVISCRMGKVYAGYDRNKEGLSRKEQTSLLEGYKKRCKIYLQIGMIGVLGILLYVKAGGMLGWEQIFTLKEFRLKTVFIPLGISYYTFSSVGYMLDVYWRKAKCEKNYLKLFTCITYFPIIMQGPISRYDKLMKQFDTLSGFQYERVCYGLQLMLWGYFKKMVVADRLVLYTTTVFSSVSEFAGVEILLAVLGNAIAIYADFSGCMDIVEGAAQTMGVTLEKNFRQPFFSRSAAEFWRRWHITLGAWFKDYVYMPIAMSPGFMKQTFHIRKKFGARAGQIVSAAVPLAVVWILTGLWHGTGKDYILWGIYWGTLIIAGTAFAPEFKKITQFLRVNTETFGWRLFQMARTFALFCVGRMITAAGSVHGFLETVKQMFAETRAWTLFDGSLYTRGLDQKNFYVALFGILLIWAADMLHTKYNIRESLGRQPLVLRWAVYYSAVALVLVFGMYGSVYDASSFIYAGF